MTNDEFVKLAINAGAEQLLIAARACAESDVDESLAGSEDDPYLLRKLYLSMELRMLVEKLGFPFSEGGNQRC